jgi:hypothetical protein
MKRSGSEAVRPGIEWQRAQGDVRRLTYFFADPEPDGRRRITPLRERLARLWRR